MTKKEAVSIFRETIAPEIFKTYGRNDKPAIREAWNNWTDSLCKDGQITMRQYETWTHPF